ncbi:pilus assembly FimT family protein [Hydrogenothermus marinus]|uniref:Type IV fimbrial biogenesis protein FimT n=1 Tax=Hydrogenothermus marinus TaxID=133270 RepID=A0A3M0C238_9AQUI|nr:prepilin-type N-terminal cleavage/methylation domain-containing protein [Hydrogenothermus marinus]RMA97012.1 type IV fimbrial biogenesis protein FimT [Hydrogenothermus marinus]
MVRKIKAFTLLELLVVIAIMAIILGIAIPNFFKWKKQKSIESDTKQIYAFIQKARAKAFTEKEDLTIQATGNKICLYQGNTQIECKDLENKFSGTINIYKRGYFSKSNIHIQDSSTITANYDCIAVSTLRVKLGKWDGSSCKAL